MTSAARTNAATPMNTPTLRGLRAGCPALSGVPVAACTPRTGSPGGTLAGAPFLSADRRIRILHIFPHRYGKCALRLIEQVPGVLVEGELGTEVFEARTWHVSGKDTLGRCRDSSRSPRRSTCPRSSAKYLPAG